MVYVEHGKSGVRVSRLGFGAMRLPTRPGGKVDRGKAVPLLRRAVELGVTFFDTAWCYHDGESEEALGEALAGVRDKVVIQTKNLLQDKRSYRRGESHRSRLEAALRKLRTDHIDFYLAHSITAPIWREYGREWLQMATLAKEEGLVRCLGFSSHDTPENIGRLLETGQFSSLVVQYNLLDRRYAPCLARARELGVGTAVMGPVGGGSLGSPSHEIRRFLAAGSASSAELALRFVLANRDVCVAMSGMGNLAQLEENVATAGRAEPLTADERGQIIRALAEKKELAELYCTGCGYCQPCPHGVAIAEIFALANTARLYGLREQAGARYAELGEKGKERRDASACEECGQCEEKCPQKIEIMAQLKVAHKLMR